MFARYDYFWFNGWYNGFYSANPYGFLSLCICCICCIVSITATLIGIGILLYAAKLESERVEKVEQKCKEYTNLACTLPSSDGKNLSQVIDEEYVPRSVFPHQVLVQLEDNIESKTWVCSGTLISEQFVLTAAHCMEHKKLDKIIVKMGSVTVNADFRVVKKVKKVHIHPYFQFNVPLRYDICLLELEENVTFSADVRPICLNTEFEIKNYSMIFTGWNRTQDGKIAEFLKMVRLRFDKIVERFCGKHFEYSQRIPDDVICLANRTHGGQKEDSGGPLQAELKSNCSNTWEQIGVLSVVGDNLYKDGNLTMQLFVKMEEYVSWITTVVWPNDSN